MSVEILFLIQVLLLVLQIVLGVLSIKLGKPFLRYISYLCCIVILYLMFVILLN